MANIGQLILLDALRGKSKKHGQKNSSLSPGHVDTDAVYNYAVILDEGNRNRGYLAAISWDAMMTSFEEMPVPPQNKLFALHFAWYYAIAEEKCEKLLDFLESFPPEICPAFQIGILNNAMRRLRGPIREQIRPRAEALWKRALAQMLPLIRELVVHWKDDLFISGEQDKGTHSADALWEAFTRTLEDALEQQPIFPMPSD